MMNGEQHNPDAGQAGLQWQKVSPYRSEATNGPYTVAGYRVGKDVKYRASRAQAFIGGVYDTPGEAKQVCDSAYQNLVQPDGHRSQ